MKRPIGIATSIAMAEMTSVPRKTGTAPKAPAPATWSARMRDLRAPSSARTGSRAAAPGGRSAQASKSSETTMPIVVRIATIEQSDHEDRQQALDAVARAEARREPGAGEEQAGEHHRAAPPRTARMRRGPASGSAARRRRRSSAAGLGEDHCPAATLLNLGRAAAIRARRRRRPSACRAGCASSRPSITLPWNSMPEQHEDEAPEHRPRSRRRRRGSSGSECTGRRGRRRTVGRRRARPDRRPATGPGSSGSR